MLPIWDENKLMRLYNCWTAVVSAVLSLPQVILSLMTIAARVVVRVPMAWTTSFKAFIQT